MSYYAKAILRISLMIVISISLSTSLLAATDDNNKILFIKPGGSEILTINNVSKDIKIIISEEDIVHARPLKEDKLYIRGKKPGYCSVTVWDNTTKSVTAVIDVTVSYDLAGLKKQIALHFSNQDIKVYGADDGIVLSGTVSGPEIVEQAIRLAQSFLPTSSSTSMVAGGASGTTSASSGADDTNSSEEGGSESTEISQTGRTQIKIGKITNMLSVAAIHQVLLEVKIAEVNRDSSMAWSSGLSYHKLGSDFGGIIGNTPVGVSGTHYFDASKVDGGSIITDFVGAASNVLLKIDNVNLALEFLEGEGLANTLAEPRLVALSGQEAKFLAGGKFPYISLTSSTDSTSKAEVKFEEFGVALKFTPIVQSNGLISLRVAPTISQIVSTVESPNGLLPLVDTRQLETTAQLHDGQTLVLAGLLREDNTNAINKVPLLGDIPVLGSLFKSNAYQNKKSDLMITITPHLISPVKEGLISYPGEFIKKPNRFEFYLQGKLEGMRYPEDKSNLSNHGFVFSSQGGLEGSYGHLAK